MINYNYIVATIHSWNVEQFESILKNQSGNWHLITHPSDLTIEKIEKIDPKYIFFPHWSWIVDDEIIEKYECVCFHSTDLPYGRGGSPIQNLIIRGHENTMISALRMVKEIDAGPIYFKSTLSLAGRAQEIFERSAKIVSKMIIDIISNKVIPHSQTGEVVHFQRRKDTRLPNVGDIKDIYNYIRMLDAKGYPNAHIKHGDFILKFTKAEFFENELYAKVKITRDKLK